MRTDQQPLGVSACFEQRSTRSTGGGAIAVCSDPPIRVRDLYRMVDGVAGDESLGAV